MDLKRQMEHKIDELFPYSEPETIALWENEQGICGIISAIPAASPAYYFFCILLKDGKFVFQEFRMTDLGELNVKSFAEKCAAFASANPVKL